MGSQLHGAKEEGEVSNCVSNLIQAFKDGLNIFKRVRERRRRRKSRKQHSEVERVTGAELQLSDSLKKGPRELADRYAQCYGAVGEHFAYGDGKLEYDFKFAFERILSSEQQFHTRLLLRR